MVGLSGEAARCECTSGPSSVTASTSLPAVAAQPARPADPTKSTESAKPRAGWKLLLWAAQSFMCENGQLPRRLVRQEPGSVRRQLQWEVVPQIAGHRGHGFLTARLTTEAVAAKH